MARQKRLSQPESTEPAAPVPPANEHERETVIMFVDIMGASEVSNHKTLKDYFLFVNRFQEMFHRVCDRYIENWFDEGDRDYIRKSARGDEGLLMIFRPEPDGISGDIDAAIHIALELKREWICEKENMERICGAGLLPINLAIGIHVGRTHLEKSDDGWNPEGYAINLAKRIENYSRLGRFTNIFVSESAHGFLNSLPDEKLYIFDSPQVFSPKNISRDIRVYEVKHHYLPSDWRDMTEKKASARSKALYDPSRVNLDVLVRCLRINPTNVWLAEELVRSGMLVELSNGVTDLDAGAKPFERAYEVADQLVQSDQRDAGALLILGLVEGERGDYRPERRRYADAIKFTDQLAEAHWYMALSYSYEVFDSLEEDTKVKYSELDDEKRDFVDKAITFFEDAKLRRSGSAWISFDYGCELLRWSRTESEVSIGFDQIELAVRRLPEVAEKIAREPYLAHVRGHERLKKFVAE